MQLEPDATDAFLVAGQRSARVPTLLPGAEAQLVWSLIPIECGFVRIPRIRVMDKRKAGLISPNSAEEPPATEEEGIPVRIIDLRRDERVEVADVDENSDDASDGVDSGSGNIGPVLVLP